MYVQTTLFIKDSSICSFFYYFFLQLIQFISLFSVQLFLIAIHYLRLLSRCWTVQVTEWSKVVIGFPLRNHSGHSLQKLGPAPIPALLWLATKSWAGSPAVQCSLQVRWQAVCMSNDNIQFAKKKLAILFHPRALPSSVNWLYNFIYFILLITELPTLNATLLGSLSVSTCSIRCPTAWRVLWHTSPAAPWRASSGWTHGSSEQLLHKEGTNTVMYNPDSYYETGQLIEHKKKKDLIFHLINGLRYSSM